VLGRNHNAYAIILLKEEFVIENSDAKAGWRWRINPRNNRAVQVKPNQHGARWKDYETYDCPAIALEVVLACQGLTPPLDEEEVQP